jgi:DNA polymerase I-like protein with 3'-5' exonuclease and polymerase domains
MSYRVWDIETTIHSSFKRKANPFDPNNFVVMSGHKAKGGKVIGEYFGKGKKPVDWFTKLLDNTKLLIGQNIKFDVLYALNDLEHGHLNKAAWMNWVANGGLVWDTQLAEYLLEGLEQSSHMLSMDELAPKYGGNLKFDEVKSLWAAGISTENIDPALLRTYLCGTYAADGTTLEHGDIGNTEIIFLGQLERARAAGQTKSILLNMGSLLCTIEMENNGMAVDLELGLKQAEELAEQVAALTLELSAYLPKDLPFEFNWASAQQKSAIIFGGTVKYSKWAPHLDDQGNLQYAKKDAKAYYANDGSFPIVEYADTLGEEWKFNNVQQYASGKNAGEYKTKTIKVDNIEKPKGAITDFPYTFPGFTEPKKKWATDTPGQYKTGSEVIGELAFTGIPFLGTLSKITSLAKDLGTYYVTTNDKGVSKGMLTLVQANNIIHHMLNHTSTVTARFSSSNPNLQNLPKEGKSTVKALFVSRFKDGYIIQSDFSSLEVYIQAILTKSKQLIKDLQAGLDMHCVRVSQKEGVSYEEAFDRCKNEKNAYFKEWSKKRTKAKEFSFQRAYGAGATKISDSTGMGLEEVEALIKVENERYPEIEQYYEKLTKLIKSNSRPGRKHYPHPDKPAAMCHPRVSYVRTPDNKLYSYEESASPEFLVRRGTFTSFSPTEIKNYVVQGEGGEWAKAAMWLAIREYYARANFDGKALLVNQVHDALYVDADPKAAFEAAAVLEACMLAASEFMEYYFSWPIPVPVPSDTMWGKNMMEEGKLPEGFSEQVHKVRKELREKYMAGYVPSFDVA